MRKLFCITIAVLFIFTTLSTNLFSKEKSNRKVKIEFSINNPISTPFEPADSEISEYLASTYDNIAFYLGSWVLGRGSSWDFLEARICISDSEGWLRGRVLSKEFSYDVGDNFPVDRQRQFTLSQTGVPFRAGVSIPVLQRWSVEVAYSQTKRIELKQVSELDSFTIITLEQQPGIGEYSWWEMYFDRTYKYQTSTIKFQDINADLAVKYELLPDSKTWSLSPELGVSLSFLQREIKGETQTYGYFPTQLPGVVFPGESLDNFRELRSTEKESGSGSEFKLRFFAGLSADVEVWKFFGLTARARVFTKKLHTYTETTILGEFPFDIKTSQFYASAGITITF